MAATQLGIRGAIGVAGLRPVDPEGKINGPLSLVFSFLTATNKVSLPDSADAIPGAAAPSDAATETASRYALRPVRIRKNPSSVNISMPITPAPQVPAPQTVVSSGGSGSP